jgi:Ca2+-binding RTX toxin-like protein
MVLRCCRRAPLIGAALAVAFAAPASGATISINASNAVVVDGTAAVEHLTVTVQGSEIVATTDAADTFTPTAPCTAIGTQGRCPIAGVVGVTIDSSPGGDTSECALALTLPCQLIADEGTGDHLIGGGGSDRLLINFSASGAHAECRGGNDIVVMNRGSATMPVTLDGVANDGLTGWIHNVDCDNVELSFGGVATGNAAPNRLVATNTATVSTLDGGAGPDTLVSGVANDILHGGDGDDLLSGGNGNDTLDGGPGDDLLSGGPSNDTLDGAAGNDVLDGEGENDTLHGGDGNDIVAGGFSGTDTIDGGPGVDTADYAENAGRVRVTLDDVANDGAIGAGGTVTENDNVLAAESILSGAGNDELTGNGGDNVLIGGRGNDVLHGGGGDDRLIGDSGADQLIGDGGLDVADYRDRAVSLTVTLDGLANDGVAGEGDNALTEGVEGGSAGDTLTGSAGADSLAGGPGADTIAGAGGDDLIAGGDGPDQVTAGSGTLVINLEDGEVDTATCTGDRTVTLLSDPADQAATCVSTPGGGNGGGGNGGGGGGGGGGGPSGGQPEPVPSLPGARIGRTPAALRAAITRLPKKGSRLRLRGARLDAGRFACSKGLRCQAIVELRAGRRLLGRALVRVASTKPARLRLLVHAPRRWPAHLKLVVTVIEGGRSATVGVSLRPPGGRP